MTARVRERDRERERGRKRKRKRERESSREINYLVRRKEKSLKMRRMSM